MGAAKDAGDVMHWIVRRSLDGGITWTTVDDFQLNSGQDSAALDITVDSAGRPWVTGCGGGSFSTQDCRWLVRRGDVNGLNWTTVMDFDAGKALGTSITMAGPGRVLVSGASGNPIGWMSRLSVDDGLVWGTTDDHRLNPIDFGVAQANLAHSSGALFSAGMYLDNTLASGFWETRSSSDGGLTWNTVERFNVDVSSPDTAAGIFETLTGDIYVVGAVEGASDGHWKVRRSSDLGLTWKTADEFLYEPAQFHLANAGGVDLLDRPYVAGRGRDASSKEHWLIRRGDSEGGNWSTMDDFQYVAGQASEARAFVRDAAGNLYAAGFGEDGTAPHALTRKLDCL